MIIIIPISDFSFELFPMLKTNRESLINELENIYSVGSVKPIITIENELIKIEINIENIEQAQTEYNELIGLCNSGEFQKALPLAKLLVSKYPTHSEYFRILGQIFSELDDQKEAINSLIDALRWNPKNNWALIMMGNIFSKFKNDIDTAMIYYNEVIKNNPNDYLSLNNIGATMLQLGKNKEAKEYLEKASIQNPNYPNTFFGLALVTNNENDLNASFEYVLKTLQLSNVKDNMFNNSLGLLNEIVVKLSESNEVQQLINSYIGSLESKYNTNIKIVEDNSIFTSAKIEIKENYDRDYHLIKYKSSSPAYSHLVIHELLHLELIEEARVVDKNRLFISNNSHKSKFIFLQSDFAKKLSDKGVPEDSINKYLSALFDGLNLQVFNTPIDLFIEDIIFNKFKLLKPIQFFSLLNLLFEGVEATTRKDIVENSPKDILSVSKTFNLINALHFKKLYGIDLINSFNASKIELDAAIRLYDEFLEYRENRDAGEEYEIIQHWGEDLKVDGFFDLVLESNYRNQNIEDVLDSISKDPYNLENSDSSNERKMREFIKNNTTDELNFAVVMYMVDALNFFKNKDSNELKKIAFEFATLGMSGIDPNKENYSVLSIPNNKMSGYKALAFYYVSWALGIPEMLKDLQMPFDKEYQIANQFNTSK